MDERPKLTVTGFISGSKETVGIAPGPKGGAPKKPGFCGDFPSHPHCEFPSLWSVGQRGRSGNWGICTNVRRYPRSVPYKLEGVKIGGGKNRLEPPERGIPSGGYNQAKKEHFSRRKHIVSSLAVERPAVPKAPAGQGWHSRASGNPDRRKRKSILPDSHLRGNKPGLRLPQQGHIGPLHSAKMLP